MYCAWTSRLEASPPLEWQLKHIALWAEVFRRFVPVAECEAWQAAQAEVPSEYGPCVLSSGADGGAPADPVVGFTAIASAYRGALPVVATAQWPADPSDAVVATSGGVSR